jgi:pimeloyl-ACP methyl ester carboxylesterase
LKRRSSVYGHSTGGGEIAGYIAKAVLIGACVKQFSETDFNADLKKLDVPTLILHGDDDQTR